MKDTSVRLAEMEEEYKAMAEINRLLAEQFLPVIVETWPKTEKPSKSKKK